MRFSVIIKLNIKITEAVILGSNGFLSSSEKISRSNGWIFKNASSYIKDFGTFFKTIKSSSSCDWLGIFRMNSSEKQRRSSR